jgi:hypothetical protein
MRWLLEVMGELIDRIIGPSITTESFVAVHNQELTIHPTFKGDKVHLTIRSRRITYKTTFTHWYIPDVYRTVYEVVGLALPEHRERLDPKLLETVVYPCLSIPLLKWSEYPHAYAINAYLDRAPTPHDSIEV